MRQEIEDIEVDLLLQSICGRYGYDFRGYTRETMKRRATHAATALGFGSVSELQGAVLRSQSLFVRLVSILAVSVTQMFRDPEFFVALRSQVVPYLRTYPSFKIWIAGCSTGEEVVSLSILLDEEGLLERSLIYATDINLASLERARRGVYRGEDVAAYTRNYVAAGGRRSLSDYYVADYDAVMFEPRLLERVVFAEHSLATDAVFSEIQLVSCRNVLIYFDQVLQNRALGLFAEALCPHGFLCLGTTETISNSSYRDRFAPQNPERRIYTKR